MSDTDGWALAGEFSNIQEAYIAKGMLEDNGIRAVVDGGTLASVYPMTLTWAPVRLLVPGRQLERALDLLHGVH